MYNYLMLVMYAIEQDQNEKLKRTQGAKSQAQMAKEQIGSFKELLGEDPGSVKDSDVGMITIQVTPEDMKEAKKEREKRQKDIKERKKYLKPGSTNTKPKPGLR